MAVDRLAIVSPGDTLLMDGQNSAGDPVDFVAFWLGSDQSIRQVYPDDERDSPRLAAGERLRRAGMEIDPGSTGVERLLVLTVPMRRGSEAADFRFLEQSPLSRLRVRRTRNSSR